MALKVEELRDEYMDRLLDRITEVRYPSKELLDRAENLAYTPEQAERLVRYLIATVENAPRRAMRDTSIRNVAKSRNGRLPASRMAS